MAVNPFVIATLKEGIKPKSSLCTRISKPSLHYPPSSWCYTLIACELPLHSQAFQQQEVLQPQEPQQGAQEEPQRHPQGEQA